MLGLSQQSQPTSRLRGRLRVTVGEGALIVIAIVLLWAKLEGWG
jgi:hypothetical protein